MHFAWTIDFGLRIQKPFYKNKHEMSNLHQNSPGKQWLQPVYNQKLLQFLSCVEPINSRNKFRQNKLKVEPIPEHDFCTNL